MKREAHGKAADKSCGRIYEGRGKLPSISKKYGIHRETLLSYVRRAQAEGIDVLRIGSQNKKYSKATKPAAVNEYLAGKGNQSEICTKNKITNKSILQKWIKWYNSGKDFKERRGSERGVTMRRFSVYEQNIPSEAGRCRYAAEYVKSRQMY